MTGESGVVATAPRKEQLALLMDAVQELADSRMFKSKGVYSIGSSGAVRYFDGHPEQEAREIVQLFS